MGNITETTIKKRDKKNRKRKYQLLAFVMGSMFLCCIIFLIAYLSGLHRAEEDLEDMRASYVSLQGERVQPEPEEPGNTGAAMPEQEPEENTPSEPDSGAAIASDESEPAAPDAEQPDYGLEGKTVDIAALQEDINEHIYAWLSVPGTIIDFPVVQHPEEMDYYLEYNLDGTKGRPGGIYTQRMNSKDWTDPNTIIYGHNMRNGTMFADLHKFEDRDFFDENRYIHIYTEGGEILIYEIFAAYVTDNRHQLMIWSLDTEEGYQSYLDAIPEHTGKGCNFREDIHPTTEDKILTLSTCVYQQNDKRYLVQGVLVAREEQP
ncbi:MAG: sortase [Butyrivibrio sp.]|nr:sortase [Butyrivibrio sp.]